MSTELAEFRRAIQELRDISTRTENNVVWIRDGMETTAQRIAANETRIGKVENRQHWLAGIYSSISAGLAVFGVHLFGGHAS